jgi:hypothetical protein
MTRMGNDDEEEETMTRKIHWMVIDVASYLDSSSFHSHTNENFVRSDMTMIVALPKQTPPHEVS